FTIHCSHICFEVFLRPVRVCLLQLIVFPQLFFREGALVIPARFIIGPSSEGLELEDTVPSSFRASREGLSIAFRRVPAAYAQQWCVGRFFFVEDESSVREHLLDGLRIASLSAGHRTPEGPASSIEFLRSIISSSCGCVPDIPEGISCAKIPEVELCR